MAEPAKVLVQMFGSLHTYRRKQGLSPKVELDVPAEGILAVEIARQLELPLEKIEGVIHNHKVKSLDCAVMPGDKLAFVPRGIPGPYRFMLGIYAAGKRSQTE